VPAEYIIDQQIIVPQHIWKNVKDPLTWTDPSPVVTGPYVLDKFTPNQYTLKKNTGYWQADKVAPKTLVLPASNTQLDVSNNGYDWAYSFITDVNKTWVDKNKQHNTYWFPPGGTVSLFPNLTKAPYNNLDFREGLSYALDRGKVATAAEDGYVKPAGQSGLLLPNQKSLLDPSLPNGGDVSQDTAKAMDYFAKAGYTKSGSKLVDSSGKQLSISILTANGYSDWLQGLQNVKSQLGSLGIAVTITQPQPAAYTQDLDTGNFDVAMGSFGGTGNAFQDYNNLLNSAFAAPIGTSTSANFERFKDPATDAVLAQLKVATSTADQQKLTYQLQNTVYTQLPVIGLFYGGLWGLFSTKNFTGWPSASNAYAPPNTWNSTPLLILTHLKAAG
jgi:peptide/nickel transport system substrate-binding protein